MDRMPMILRGALTLFGYLYSQMAGECGRRFDRLQMFRALAEFL
jgi:hypothetical protein